MRKDEFERTTSMYVGQLHFDSMKKLFLKL